MSSWEKFVKKYVWDERTTPFLVPVHRLNRGQADKEVFLFVLFLATPFTLILLGALAYLFGGGAIHYIGVALYAASVLAAAVALNASKQWQAAVYCITAPLAILLYFVVNGFGPKMQTLDQVLMVAMLVAWARYTIRIIAIARTYPGMPAAPPAR
jgi:hypothetical protein